MNAYPSRLRETVYGSVMSIRGATYEINSSSVNLDTCSSGITADLPVMPSQYQPSIKISISSSLVGIDAKTIVSGSFGTSLKISFKLEFLFLLC